ncbi:MAG: hypothetical protein HC793_04355 [Aquincola sp.]|nr:hypothetical protein [Aquincola sp.]
MSKRKSTSTSPIAKKTTRVGALTRHVKAKSRSGTLRTTERIVILPTGSGPDIERVVKATRGVKVRVKTTDANTSTTSIGKTASNPTPAFYVGKPATTATELPKAKSKMIERLLVSLPRN